MSANFSKATATLKGIITSRIRNYTTETYFSHPVKSVFRYAKSGVKTARYDDSPMETNLGFRRTNAWISLRYIHLHYVGNFSKIFKPWQSPYMNSFTNH